MSKSVAAFAGLVFLCLCLDGAVSCRPGWHYFRGFCYYYKHELYTFFEAKATCDLFDSTVTEIRSDVENQFLLQLITNSSDSLRYPGNVAWIGLEDLETEGTFIWYNSQEPASYTSWFHLDPNNLNEEDCVTTRSDGKWQDWQCETKHPFICRSEGGAEEIIG